MAWIESHQALEKHPKILDLSIVMGWSLDETLGKIHRFWWWCLDYAPTGDLRQVNWASLGMALGMTADDSLKFRDALLSTHLICRLTRTRLPWRVHDWIDYAGRYLRDTKFKRSPEKYEQVIDLYKLPCQPTVSRQSADLSCQNMPPVSRQSAVPTNQPTILCDRRQTLEEFVLTDEIRNWARQKFQVEIPDEVFREFKDHWRKEPDKKLRTDWTATFQMQIRKLVGWKVLKPEFGIAKTSRPTKVVL